MGCITKFQFMYILSFDLTLFSTAPLLPQAGFPLLNGPTSTLKSFPESLESMFERKHMIFIFLGFTYVTYHGHHYNHPSFCK